jgi:hypothetical protein
MDTGRWARYAPLSGAAFVVLFIVGMLVVNNYDYLPPSDEIQAFYEDGATRVAIGGYLAMLSAFFLLWFAGSVRTSLRSREGEPGRLASIAFGGTVAAAAGTIVTGASLMAGGQRGGADGGIGVDTATALFDLSGAIMGVGVPIALAALVGAAAVVSFRHGMFANWLSWASAILAVGLVSPAGYIFIGFAALWILVVGVMLYRAPEAVAGA